MIFLILRLQVSLVGGVQKLGQIGCRCMCEVHACCALLLRFMHVPQAVHIPYMRDFETTWRLLMPYMSDFWLQKELEWSFKPAANAGFVVLGLSCLGGRCTALQEKIAKKHRTAMLGQGAIVVHAI